MGKNQENQRNNIFPENIKYVIYKTNTKNDIIKILSLNQKNIKSIKRRAPDDSYWFILEDENHNRIPWFYILDWEIKSTNRMSDEDWYYDREASQVVKTIGKCKKYVKTRILNLFLKFDPKTMKII